MMRSITEAIYETYATAAFLQVPRHDRHFGAPSYRSARPPVGPRRRPIGGLLARARKASGRALTGLAAALQASGDRLIGAEQS